jgi:hypothetical protein
MTGELIYHDRRNFVLPKTKRPLGRHDAVLAARRWLRALGWPADRMPLRSATPLPDHPRIRSVVFGWAGVGPAAIEEATLWVTPDRSVVEALVWPPVLQKESIPARSIHDAWSDVQQHHAPLAVRALSFRSRATGSGVLRRASVVSVLTRGTDRRLYLVPAYRFAGDARFTNKSGTYRWVSLTPGGEK